MSNTIENPNAFAFGYGTDNYDRSEPGMSLRDYFAAKAMQAILSNQALFLKVLESQDDKTIKSSDAVANNAYAIADEMLKQRLTPIKESNE